MNPNEYDDEKFLQATHELEFGGNLADGVRALWEAGCDFNEIAEEVERVVENVIEDIKTEEA